MDISDTWTKDNYRNFISVSISKQIQELVKELKFDNEAQLKLLSHNEAEMIKYFRTEKPDYVKVTFKDGEIQEIHLTRVQDTQSAEARLKELIADSNYKEISFSTENGKVRGFKNTKKIRL